MNNNMDEKLRDLLSDQAIFGLTEDETKQLAELSEGADIGMNAHTLELTAAAILLAETSLDEAMPVHLEARILEKAKDHFAAQRSDDPVHESIHDQPTRSFQWTEPKPRGSLMNWLGWATAAAASVVLVGSIFYNQNRISELEAKLARATPSPIVEETLAQKRDRLLADATDITRAQWTKATVKETENVTGEIVWSDAKQAGYMTFKGLPVNDANREAYQLWMFEDAKLEDYPKDGGVFNVTADGEVIIPINAKLRTISPKAFAITVEKPGGVVVSDRSKIALLAPVKPSAA